MASAVASKTRRPPGSAHRLERLRARHRRQPYTVLQQAGHQLPPTVEWGQIVLAQRDQHPVVAASEVETLRGAVVLIETRLQRLRRAVLHQIPEFLDELGRALSTEVIDLREGEKLLELIEDEQRENPGTHSIVQHIVAVVQKLPERLSGVGNALLRPLSRSARGAPDRRLDLLGGLGALASIGDAHIHRAVALLTQLRDQAHAHVQGLAQPRFAKEDREELALHAPDELGDLLVAPEKYSRVSSVKETSPR